MPRNFRMLFAAGGCAAMLGFSSSAFAEGPHAAGLLPPPPFGPLLPPPSFGALPIPPFGLDTARLLSAGTPSLAVAAPRDACLNEIAAEAALHAYVVAKLTLTDAQEPLWQRLEAAFRKGAEARRKTCESLPATVEAPPPSLPRAMAIERDMLTARLAELQEVQPALTPLYDSLSPEQRSVLERQEPARR